MCTYATWNYANGACFHVTRENGYIDLWNMNCNDKKPVNVLKICNDTLSFAKTRQEGDIVAVCSMSGDLHLVRYSHAVFFSDETDERLFEELIDRQLRYVRMGNELEKRVGKRVGSVSEEDYVNKSDIIPSMRDLSISASEANSSVITDMSLQAEVQPPADIKPKDIAPENPPKHKEKPSSGGEHTATGDDGPRAEEEEEDMTFAKNFWGKDYDDQIGDAERDFFRHVKKYKSKMETLYGISYELPSTSLKNVEEEEGGAQSKTQILGMGYLGNKHKSPEKTPVKPKGKGKANSAKPKQQLK
uniref:Uncharacterized protein n=1 Tax=Cacopsylla melanoneura TaxID=428564 RepID=A0A8D9B246_9HEMI